MSANGANEADEPYGLFSIAKIGRGREGSGTNKEPAGRTSGHQGREGADAVNRATRDE